MDGEKPKISKGETDQLEESGVDKPLVVPDFRVMRRKSNGGHSRRMRTTWAKTLMKVLHRYCRRRESV